jgi:5'-deoxynucleotidase YfbR-like HD superfamily hydrolase
MHINIGLKQYMQNVDGLRNLVRYQSAPRVSSETVAEHSYFVAAYVLKLHNYYEFDLKKALSIAILHDYAEVFISDVPHPIKKDFPLLAESLEKAENKIVTEHISGEFADWLNEFNNTSTPEGAIVALADILSVVAYAKYEIGLGNSEYMRNVIDKSVKRANVMFELCEKYLYDDVSKDDVVINVYNFAYNINNTDE